MFKFKILIFYTKASDPFTVKSGFFFPLRHLKYGVLKFLQNIFYRP